MNSDVNHMKYISCTKEILLCTFAYKQVRLNFYFSFLVLCAGVLANILIPVILKKSIESFTSDNPFSIPLILFGYGFIWTISQLSIHVRALLISKVEQRITFILGMKVLSHLYSLSHNYFLNQKPGALTNVIRRAQRSVPNIVLGFLLHILPTIFEFLMVIILICSLYPLIYSLLMAGILGVFLIYTSISLKLALKEREIANEIDMSVDGIVSDWISNYEAIKVFNKYKFAIQKCEKELKKRENSEISFTTKYCFSHIGQTLILGIGVSLLTYLTGRGVSQGLLTIGDFLLFNGYILQFILPVNTLGHIIQEVKKAMIDMKGIMELLITQSEIKESSNPIHLTGSNLSISFKDVYFKYNQREILKKASFTIEEGETVLIIGPTGTGKSTIAKLLLRLYDPAQGEILINNINIKQYTFTSLYEVISWVPQESYLLNDTIKENIHFVNPYATLADIEDALENAHALNFIKKLPLGLHTHVGDRGLKLSGGEKQRLALARLFIKKPKICIFDESTSFLDKNTELIIQKNIKKFLPNTIKIIITHRPYMLDNVDKVIFLNEGTVDITRYHHNKFSWKN